MNIMRISEMSQDDTVLPAVWQMRRKRGIRTRKINNYKAILNIDGSRMKHGQHSDQTYSPVASWNSIPTLLIMSAFHDWYTRKIDYVLVFPQDLVKREIYMQIPNGFKINEGRTSHYVLKLHRNIYGQKQAGMVWNKYLTNILVNKFDFSKATVDKCVLYRINGIYVLYNDYYILSGPDLK